MDDKRGCFVSLLVSLLPRRAHLKAAAAASTALLFLWGFHLLSLLKTLSFGGGGSEAEHGGATGCSLAAVGHGIEGLVPLLRDEATLGGKCLPLFLPVLIITCVCRGVLGAPLPWGKRQGFGEEQTGLLLQKSGTEKGLNAHLSLISVPC